MLRRLTLVTGSDDTTCTCADASKSSAGKKRAASMLMDAGRSGKLARGWEERNEEKRCGS